MEEIKRTLSLLLIGILAAQTLVSCGSDKESGTQTTDSEAVSSEETTAAKPEYSLPEKESNGGKTFRILAAGNRNERFDADQTGDVVDDAVYERKRAVEEYLGLKVEFVEIDSSWQVADTFAQHISSSVMAEDDAYDLVSGSMTVLPKLALEGIFYNVLDLDIDLENPWWVGGLRDTAAINGKLYSLVGDMSMTMYNAEAVVYFNEKLRADNDLPDLYELVRSGKWTVDEMLIVAKGLSVDLDGDDKITRDADKVGIIGHYTPLATIQAATGISVFGRDGGGLVYKGLDEKLVSLCEKLSAAVSDNTLLLGEGETYEAWAVPFIEDRNLLHVGILNVSGSMRNMKSDYGILPFPKYDENQTEYLSDVSLSTVLWAVTVNVSDAELTSKFCEVYGYQSWKNVVPAYYVTTLEDKYSRDDQTKEMLGIIRDGMRLTLDGYLNHCFSTPPLRTVVTILSEHASPTSYFAQNASGWQKQLDTIIEAYK